MDYSHQAFDYSDFFEPASQEQFHLYLELPLAYGQPSMHSNYHQHPQTPPPNPSDDLLEASSSLIQPQSPNYTIPSSSPTTDPDQESESNTRSARRNRAIRRQPRERIGRPPRNRQTATQTNGRQSQGTRNFLVFFRNGHKEFLEKFLARHPQYFHLRTRRDVKAAFYEQGHSITRWDYEHLYRIPELYGCWSQMHQHKYLLRHLMIGKARICQKLVYRAKVHLFQRAFQLGKFENIN